MKASDFTTGGNDREKAMSNLLKTEKTDAVNTGLVEKADKSAKALKGDLYSVGKKGTHGAGSTALDAIARKRKKTSAADALDGKSRSQITGKNALTKKVQSRHNLNKSLKRGAKGVAAKAAHNALKDSELEGTDDLVATTHTGAKLAGKARKHLRSGKDALEKKDSLGALSEKKYRTEKLDKKAAQKRMQFSKYFHRNVYENAATQAGKKKALTILSGGIKGMLSSLAGAVSQFFPLIIAFILAFGLISVVGGGAADEEQKSASLDGMPAWVTYGADAIFLVIDLVPMRRYECFRRRERFLGVLVFAKLIRISIADILVVSVITRARCKTEPKAPPVDEISNLPVHLGSLLPLNGSVPSLLLSINIADWHTSTLHNARLHAFSMELGSLGASSP